MTREQLEAVIWQQMPVTPRSEASVARVDAILTAADAYADYTGGITAERRATLARSRP